jgi:translation initiation factor IF-2
MDRRPVSSGPSIPTRIVSEQIVPKRISREEIAAEVKAKTGGEEPPEKPKIAFWPIAKQHAAVATETKTETAEVQTEPVLPTSEATAPSIEEAKPKTEVAQGSAKEGKSSAEAAQKTGESALRTMEPAPKTEESTETVVTVTPQAAATQETVGAKVTEAEQGKPPAAQTTSKVEGASRPQSQSRSDGSAQGNRRASGGGRPAQGGRSPQGARPGTSGQSPRQPKKKDGEAKKDDGKPRQSNAKPKAVDAKPKASDKKPGGRDKGKPGEGYGDKARKHKLQTEKRKGSVEDFKGSRKSPILEDNSLEKRPLKTPRRGRPQPRPEPVPMIQEEDLAPGTKIINVPITVAGFAEQVERSATEIIMALMKLGIMANINQNIDETTTQLLGDELNIPIFIGKDSGEIVEEGLETFDDSPEDLRTRPPIITVMGHVDHGKTSLLDAIRKTNVTVGEAGGITQHIGASEVYIKGEKIVFLDTPGHEAFTAMRARGAHSTDIAVLVVAADDGVMPQTMESISHARAAGVPIIVAINKMDKEGANPDRVKQELSDNGVLVEEWGGDTISVPVSAKTGEGIVTLLEMILLQAEVLELKANPDRLALGTVIEARLDKAKGAVATLLVLNGTLDAGDSIVAGTTSGRIRAMTDYNGKSIKKAGPATAVEITGLSEVPEAGDEFNAVREDRVAREIAESRRIKQREEVMARTSGSSLETLFSRIQGGEIKELNIIIKGDVQGSVGALTSSLEKLDTENVRVKIIHTGVGAVTESDVMLANTSGAVIIGFNVRPGTAVLSLAEREGVEIRSYRVIYDAIDEVEAALKGMLDPIYKEVILGKVEIRNTFKVPGVGVIGGAYVLEGKVQRNAEIRLVRDGIVIHEGKISSLKRFKDDAREVASGYECGIGIENYNDIKEGDIIEAFKMEQIERE